MYSEDYWKLSRTIHSRYKCLGRGSSMLDMFWWCHVYIHILSKWDWRNQHSRTLNSISIILHFLFPVKCSLVLETWQVAGFKPHHLLSNLNAQMVNCDTMTSCWRTSAETTVSHSLPPYGGTSWLQLVHQLYLSGLQYETRGGHTSNCLPVPVCCALNNTIPVMAYLHQSCHQSVIWLDSVYLVGLVTSTVVMWCDASQTWSLSVCIMCSTE